MSWQLRQFVDSSPDAMLIVDPAGRIRHANAPAATLFGYNRERLRGESIRTIVPDQPLPLISEDPNPPKRDSRRLALVCQRSDAGQFPAEVSVVLVRAAHGPVGMVTVRDMTEAQRAQFVLERSAQVLASDDWDRQQLFGHLVRAQEEERKRIAAGIHDDTMQLLTAANLRLQQLRHRLRGAAEADILDKLEEAFELSLSRLRQLIFDLRPSGLVDNGLAAALRVLLEQLQEEVSVTRQLDDGLITRIPAETAVLIYRTVQEALTNVRKHARATTVRVELADLCHGCLVRVDDDGVGYNPADVEHTPGHLGLVLMRERPELAGGWCKIESAPGAGTSVEFWVPVRQYLPGPRRHDE